MDRKTQNKGIKSDGKKPPRFMPGVGQDTSIKIGAMDLYSLNILGGISVLDSIVDTYQYSPHWHEEYVIAIYRDGAKQYQCGRHHGIAKADDLLIIAPGTVHSAMTFDGIGWSYLSLYLTSSQCSKATGINEETLVSKIHDFSQLSYQSGLVRQAFQVFDAGTGSNIAFCEWLIALLDTVPKCVYEYSYTPPNLVRVYEQIMDDPTMPIAMDELSAIAGVTPEHLSRSFKQSYGLSPFQLLIAARIQTARKLITKGVPLATAAVSAGFSDQSHMTRWIKRAFGVSPGFFRRYQ